MTPAWRQAITKLETSLSPSGLDLVWPLTVGAYNATLVDQERLQLKYPPETLAILVGNTKELWDPLKTWYIQQKQQQKQTPRDPVEVTFPFASHFACLR